MSSTQSSDKKFDVTVVGSCMRDLTGFTPHLPKPGETVIGSQFNFGYGGKGANQCLAAVRLQCRAAMVAKVGIDSHGDSYIETLKSHGVNTDHVTQTDETHTGIASIFVADNGENCIVIVNGANGLLSTEDVHHAEELIASSHVVVCQLETNIESTLAAFQLARRHGVTTLFNVAPARNDIPDELLKLCDIVCVNESEAELMTGQSVSTIDDAEKAGRLLLSKGCKMVVVTLGEKGAIFSNPNGSFEHVPATKVKAVDTTGAGDAFVGALAFYLSVLKELPMHEAIKRACHIASISVQYPGTHVSFPFRKDLPEDMFC